MRWTLSLLLLAGCQISPVPQSADLFETAVPVQRATDGPDAEPEPTLLPDTLARGPFGQRLSMDSLQALAADADTSASGTVALIGRAGTYHQGEVPAQTGERWQGLYPASDGVELRTFALRVETVRDEVVDNEDGPFTGERVTTPFSTPADGYGYPDDDALFLVRRPGAPFVGPVATAFAGSWPVQSGQLELLLGERRYVLSIVEGPETVLMPQRETIRAERVLVLSDGDGREQPVAHLVDRDAARPALLWAGDLDGDSRLDLLLDESWHYNLSAPTLYLSGEAAGGALVRRVARHQTVGC